MNERNGSVAVAHEGVQHEAQDNHLTYRRPSPKEMQKRFEGSCCHNALEFLQQLRPAPWVLTAILPDGDTATFTCKTKRETEKVIRAYNGVRNIYYSVNPTRTAMTKKAAKKDIAAAEFIHADLDPRDDETSDEAKARYLKLLTDFKPQPTMIVDSGNGLNCLWRLDQSVPPDGFEELEQRNLQITLALGGPKGTQNIDRILRLPGTINIPNAKKRQAGREQCLSV
jgi:Mesyanzhinovviridae DNA primase